MDVYLTLDFELFLGVKSGTVQNCMVKPTGRLLEIARKTGMVFTFFVDAAYLVRLNELKQNHTDIQTDFDEVTNLLKRVVAEGHDVELHIHPQWVSSEYVDGEWKIDAEHYKLADITDETADELFAAGCDLLEKITGKRPIAFRAGGFSAEPYEKLLRLMKNNGLSVDSSVYPGTIYQSPQQQYNYLDAEQGRIYRFSDNPVVENRDGSFFELPLSVYPVSPLYFWKLVFQRLSKQKNHERIGDGVSVSTANRTIFKRLTRSENIHATIDESKISFLWKAFKKAQKRKDTVFCVIGHPKLATEYSLSKLEKVLQRMKGSGARFKTISQIDLASI